MNDQFLLPNTQREGLAAAGKTWEDSFTFPSQKPLFVYDQNERKNFSLAFVAQNRFDLRVFQLIAKDGLKKRQQQKETAEALAVPKSRSHEITIGEIFHHHERQ